ncbi:amino acid adenylation domain-containing protein [Alkalisalibacterium limincola]|uniref:Amino acid adenylation domain-containing protein n=1 Tax=Alkalisalibacterium limincola TaxID=2699169 RepID=A0A5C8KWM8_9GAMM|nr:amino acid adenylation domain-containing protein [Alkalisalibacterium limincola]TXK64528.1 amino acid adenylation domain-containing protein [Alkalisalibacterium limincola]
MSVINVDGGSGPVRAAPRDSTAPLALGQKERWLAASSSGPALSVPREMRLDDFVLRHLSPDQEIICGADRHDGRQLRQAVEALSSMLQARGIRRDCRVGICLERGFWMLAAPLAVMRAGACYVPMDPLFPEARLSMIADDASLDLLITTAEEVHWAGSVRLLDPTTVQHHGRTAQAAPSEVQGNDSAREPAYLIYTSGSTGRPKGVVLSHHSVVNFLMTMRERPGLARSDTMGALTTLSFDIAVLELFLPLLAGARLVILDLSDPLEIMQAIEREQITVIQATPPTWIGLIGEGWQGRPDFRVLVGGESLAPDLARQLLERAAEVWNLYGPTETTVWSTLWKVREPEAGIRIGRPVANTHILLLDDQLEPCTPGQPGEICIGGAGVALGYLDRPELTAARFIPDPTDVDPSARLYRSGDVGRWDPRGELEHLGRIDFQLKIRGYRVEPGEIEVRLREHPDVDQAVVVAREFGANDIRLVAYLTPASGRDTDVAALRRHLAQWLPAYMRPQHLAVLPALPLTPNGKIDRRALPNPIGLQRAPKPDGNLRSAE